MRFVKSTVVAVMVAGSSLPSNAMDANSLILGTLSDWFNAKSDMTMRAAEIMVARDHNATLSATELWECINEVAVGQGTGSLKVAEVAGSCMAMAE